MPHHLGTKSNFSCSEPNKECCHFTDEHHHKHKQKVCTSMPCLPLTSVEPWMVTTVTTSPNPAVLCLCSCALYVLHKSDWLLSTNVHNATNMLSNVVLKASWVLAVRTLIRQEDAQAVSVGRIALLWLMLGNAFIPQTAAAHCSSPILLEHC